MNPERGESRQSRVVWPKTPPIYDPRILEVLEAIYWYRKVWGFSCSVPIRFHKALKPFVQPFGVGQGWRLSSAGEDVLEKARALGISPQTWDRFVERQQERRRKFGDA